MESNVQTIYRKNNSERILQGDLLIEIELPIYEDKQLKFINSEYNLILSQDCDLNQDFDAHNDIEDIKETNKEISSFYNKMIPSILLCPAYPADNLREGTHLSFLELEMSKMGKTTSTSWKTIKQNNNPRYHFLKNFKLEDIEVPDLVLDFKRYYALSRNYLYSIYDECYYISLNELYREDLSVRFCNFQSRIGLP